MAWVAPRTWTDGEIVTAAMLNGIRDSLKALGDPWTAYTPTYSATIGNGSLAGAYIQTGKTVLFRFRFTAGSTTTFTSMNFGLPVAATAGIVILDPIGSAFALDASVGTAARTAGICILATSTTCTVITAKDTTGQITSTNPWTWASGDIIAVEGTYEAA